MEVHDKSPDTDNNPTVKEPLLENKIIKQDLNLCNIILVNLLISNVLISMDHGSIPASTFQLRQFTKNDQTIGLFGSFVYVGNLIGSVFIFKLINQFNRKYLLIISLLSNSILLATFVYFEKLLFLLTNRILVGIFQAYITIYAPVWCNQYGDKNKITTMIALCQLACPIGIFIGYLIAAVAIDKNFYGGWKFAFVVQAILILIESIIILFFPNSYFSMNESSVNTRMDSLSAISFNYSGLSGNQDNNMSIKGMLRNILNKVFVFSILAYSVLIYIITGIQYWVSDYMLNVLNEYSGKKRLLYFSIVCFTSPTLGVLIGTMTKNKYCKQDMVKSLIFCNVLSLFAGFFAFLVPFCSNIIIFVVFIWIVLFFGGGIVPVITHVIISSVPKDLDASGNSIAVFCSNLFGYLPAPYVYAFFNDVIWDKGVTGMRFTMWIAILGFIFFSLGTWSGYQEEKKRKNPDENDEEKALIKV